MFAALAYPMLNIAAADRTRFVCVAIFAFFSVFLLTVSGSYHLCDPAGEARGMMLRLDIVAIFLLIAASFTPLHGVLFRGFERWGMLVLIWSFALIGMAIRLIFFDSIPRQIGHSIFIVMGWLGLWSAYLIRRDFGWKLLLPVACGGVLYTIGAVSNALRWPTVIPYVWGPHETHHLTVLAALSCHWWAVLQIARGEQTFHGH